jgi:diguanylate cyclase (GGDEF)-like protein
MAVSPANASATGKWQAQRPTALSVVFWFDLLALAIGAAHVVGAGAERSAVAVMVFTVLCLTTVAVRILPSIKRRLRLRCMLEIVALLAFAVGITWATGGVHSPLLALLLLPLTAAAIALTRPLYGVVAVCSVAAVLALAFYTPDVHIASPEFVVWIISAVSPMIIATTAIVLLIEQMQGAEQYIQDLSTSDPLTGLLNQRAFDDILMREHRKAERNGRAYCLVVVDVDNVKQLNESVGRDAGDRVLFAVGAALTRSIRASDVAARLGGDEFVVLLSETDANIGNAIAARIRSHVYAGTVSVGNRMVRANVHLGLAGYPKDRRDPKELLVLANQRMQHDKEVNRPAE